jgi:UDP-glucose 6-dehydrogenase
MKNIITVGIVGCGFVGGALKQWLENNNPEVTILVSDPPKGYTDSMASTDVIFISIHVPTEADGTQDLRFMGKIIKTLPDKPIFIRTTILPGTSEKLSRETKRRVYFMPEFLTERTAYDDFGSQSMVFTAECELLERIFVGKRFIQMSSLEAEITKYAHNVFGALKVTYFNAIYHLCQKNGCFYDNVLRGILLSGYINDVHTAVPGPDGKLGYGGKCFPKDVNAFARLYQNEPIGTLLQHLKEINIAFQGADA